MPAPLTAQSLADRAQIAKLLALGVLRVRARAASDKNAPYKADLCADKADELDKCADLWTDSLRENE